MNRVYNFTLKFGVSMKIFYTLLLVAALGTTYFYTTQDKREFDKAMFSSITNSTLTELSPVFKQDVTSMIRKLTEKNIKVLNAQQTIIQVALYNSTESSKIIDILFE